ncbi:MAG: hypothetical protein ACM30G_03270 [Micromonosporaceae bacterium]
MDEELSTSVSRLGRLGPWGPVELGELALANGVVTFTSGGGGKEPGRLVFSVPADQITARFPRLYFGLGVQLTVAGKRYRFWFVSLRSAAGQAVGPPGSQETIVVGNQFSLHEVGPARAAVRAWRAALGSTEAGPVVDAD